MTRKSEAGKSIRCGFTLVEVVVSLFVISVALVMLLASIRLGLGHLEDTRRDLDACLLGQTAVNANFFGLEPPGEIKWKAQDISPLPDFPVRRLVPGDGGPRHWAITGEREVFSPESP